LTVILISIPVFAVLLDLILKRGWITALAGVILALALIPLLIRPIYLALVAVIGIAWEVIHFRIKGTPDSAAKFGEGYLRVVMKVLWWELIIIFYLSIFPVWNYPQAIPLVALCVTIIILMIPRFFEKVILPVVIFVFLAETMFFTLPQTAMAIREKIPAVDKTIAGWIQKAPGPLSDVMEIPAGSGKYNGKILFKKGERVWFKSESETPAVLWDNNKKRKMKIPHHGTIKRCTKTGTIIFVKQPHPTRMRYKILSP
jgi:hypothetical protein